MYKLLVLSLGFGSGIPSSFLSIISFLSDEVTVETSL